MAKHWATDDVIVEEAPFQCSLLNEKGFEIKTKPWAYIGDLPTHVITYLDNLEKYDSNKFVPHCIKSPSYIVYIP